MFKITTITSLLLLNTLVFGQTSVISTKSHSADIENLVDAEDAFGETPSMLTHRRMEPILYKEFAIESLIKIDDHCVIRKGHILEKLHSDTVCNYWYYEEHNYNKQSMYDFHGPEIILIGFPENAPAINTDDAPFSGRSSRMNLSWIFVLVILGSLGGFILIPRSKA